MWRPVTDADTDRRAWAVIEEIEECLQGDVTPYLPSEEGLADPMLSGGRIGLALFFAYLEAVRPGRGAAERAVEVLEESVEAMTEAPLEPSLYSGFCGVGWVTAHLSRELLGGDDDLSEIDDALGECLRNLRAIKPFELVRGLAGFGVYLLERLPDPQARELLVRVIDHLEVTARETPEGLTWWSIPQWISMRQPRFRHGCYNLGVAHGVPGVLGFLAAAHHAGVDDPRIPRLADGVVRWLLAHRLPPDGDCAFPAFLIPGDPPEPSRTAWCYGDPGVAGVLHLAGRSFGRPDWEAEALALAHLAARRGPDEGRVIDASLCHGTAGIAHMFLRLHHASGDPALRSAALDWIERTLTLRRPGEEMAGYRTWISDAVHGDSWRADPSFLMGAAGVGLALLAAVSDVEPAWDRVMLLSLAPGGDTTNGDPRP